MGMQLILSGKVQGVFCREYCSKTAKKLNLRGSATNRPDTTVKVLLDSDDKELINQYVKALKENPFGLRFYGVITQIEIEEYSGSISGDYLF